MKKDVLGAFALAGVAALVMAAKFIEVEVVKAEGDDTSADAFKDEAAFVKDLYVKAWPVVRDGSSRDLGAGEVLQGILRAIGRNVDMVRSSADQAAAIAVKGPFGLYLMSVAPAVSPHTGDRELRLSIKGVDSIEGFSVSRAPSDPKLTVAPSDFVGKARRSRPELLAEVVASAFAPKA